MSLQFDCKFNLKDEVMMMPEYRLKIIADGLAVASYPWALFRANEEFPFEKSRANFRTQLLAKMAGSKILRRLEHKHEDAVRGEKS
jgi:hypothetical protein